MESRRWVIGGDKVGCGNAIVDGADDVGYGAERWTEERLTPLGMLLSSRRCDVTGRPRQNQVRDIENPQIRVMIDSRTNRKIFGLYTGSKKTRGLHKVRALDGKAKEG